MAAIIGQMAAASRERKKRQLENGRKGYVYVLVRVNKWWKKHSKELFLLDSSYPSNTANVILGEFEGPAFDPRRHNKYIRGKIEREKRLRYLALVTGEKNDVFALI